MPSLSKPPASPQPVRKTDTTGRKETPSIFGRKPPSGEGTPSPESAEPTRAESFSEEDLQRVMSAFREEKHAQQVGDTESLVINRKVRKGEGHGVIIELASSLEGTIFERLELEITGYLRKKLQNDQIRLEKEINVPDEAKKLYTSKDKFEYMAKQNPALKDLKDRLGLDFDY